MESRITIKASIQEIEKLMSSAGYLSVSYFEEIVNGLFSATIRHKELEECLDGVFTIGQLKEILSFDSKESNRIVNLQYKACPQLFKYILKNKRDIVIDKFRLIYINVNESEIVKLSNNEDLKEEVDKVLNSPICDNCGVRTTVGFLVSYRGQECVGKTRDCPICWNFGDRTYYTAMGLKNNTQYSYVKYLISQFQ